MFYSHYFTCSTPVFPAPLTEETVFSPLYVFDSFLVDLLTVSVWLSILLHCMCLFCDYFSSVVRKPDNSTFGLFSQDCFGNVVILWSCIYFRIIHSSSIKNVMGILYFDRDCFKSIGCFERGMAIFFFFFLGPHPWHVEVPRLGVEVEL